VSARHNFFSAWLAPDKWLPARFAIPAAHERGQRLLLPHQATAACSPNGDTPRTRGPAIHCRKAQRKDIDMVIGSGVLVTILIILAIIYLAKRL
jgi:hypothetical protein